MKTERRFSLIKRRFVRVKRRFGQIERRFIFVVCQRLIINRLYDDCKGCFSTMK